MTAPKTAPWGTVETRFEPIHSAARMRDVQTVQQELAASVDVDVVNGRAANGDGGNTALWFAAQGPWPKGVDVVRVLIDAGADVNKPCEHGRTALHMAAAWGHADVVQLLMENGANPKLVDDEGLTPPMVARNGHRSNSVTAEQRRAVCELFRSLGFE
jgi:ankyrin repeat protein